MDGREVMTEEVVSVRPETPLKDVARMLAERRVVGVPVVRGDGQVLGIISETDFVLREEGERPAASGPFGWLFGDGERQAARRAKLQAPTAGECMTSPAVAGWSASSAAPT